MKRLLRTTPVFLSLILAVSSAASGQKTYAVALGGGAAIPVGKLNDAQKTGSSAIAALAIGVADLPVGVRFDGIYNNLPARAQTGGATSSGSKSQNNFGVNAGLGATFGIGPFAIFLESRYHSISRNVKKGGVFQFVPITLGVMF